MAGNPFHFCSEEKDKKKKNAKTDIQTRKKINRKRAMEREADRQTKREKEQSEEESHKYPTAERLKRTLQHLSIAFLSFESIFFKSPHTFTLSALYQDTPRDAIGRNYKIRLKITSSALCDYICTIVSVKLFRTIKDTSDKKINK